MKIMVAIKRVVKMRVKRDKTGIETTKMNPFSEIALEEALRLRESGQASEVVAIGVGPPQGAKAVHRALDMGADKGFYTDTGYPLDPYLVAKFLKLRIDDEKPQLLILGKQAVGDDCNQAGQMMAELLNWPHGTFASKVVLDKQKQIVTVDREVDGGLETLCLDLPAIITKQNQDAKGSRTKMPKEKN